jgi:hypothetical protein
MFVEFFSHPVFEVAGFNYSKTIVPTTREENEVYRKVLSERYTTNYVIDSRGESIPIYHGPLHAWAVLNAIRMLMGGVKMDDIILDKLYSTAEYAALFHDIDYDVNLPDYVNTLQAAATALRFHHYNSESLPGIDIRVVSSAIINTTFNKALQEFEFPDELDFESSTHQFNGFRCLSSKYYSQPHGTQIHWLLRDADLLGFTDPNWPHLLHSLSAELGMNHPAEKIVQINCSFLRKCRMRTVKGKELLDKYIASCEIALGGNHNVTC